MTDKELLEKAAKAAGIELLYWNDGLECYSSGVGFILPSNAIWNPLTDDGDALRLAVKLDLLGCARFKHERDVLMFTQGMDKLTATRRAITRAAAAMVKE